MHTEHPAPAAITRAIAQLGFVVEDEEKALRMWTDGLGVGPWEVTRIRSGENAADARHYGRAAEYDIHAAMCFLPGLELECISCQDEKRDSTYGDFLARGQRGLHHLLLRQGIPFAEVKAIFDRTGVPLAHEVLLDGREPCVYADLKTPLGTQLEFTDRTGDFGPPPILAKYPPEGAVQPGPFTLARPFVEKITAAAFVVEDIERAVRTWADDYGVGPWAFILRDESSVTEVTYQGRPVAQKAICAVCKAYPNLQLRLYQPLSGDESIFTDHLRRFGSSALYLYIKPALPMEQALDYCRALTGRDTVQTCHLDGGQKLAFVDFTDTIGVYLGFGQLLPGVEAIPPSPYYKFYPARD